MGTQNKNIKVVAAIQSAIQLPHAWFFSQENRIEPSKEPESVVPSTSGKRETAPCLHLLLLTILHFSASPPVSNCSSLYASCCIPVLIKGTVGLEKVFCFLWIVCVKSIINPVKYCCVSWVPRLT